MGFMGWFMGGGCEQLSTDEVKKMKEGGAKFTLVDVRTPQENAVRRLAGSKLIPLKELADRANEIPRDREVVLYCQNGVRSLLACRMLRKLGFTQVKNMAGGISRW